MLYTVRERAAQKNTAKPQKSTTQCCTPPIGKQAQNSAIQSPALKEK